MKKINPLSAFAHFFKVESLSGILLMGTTIIALLWANSPWAANYFAIWEWELGIGIGDFKLEKPLILWINDGLMALFFFLIGLEIKREIMVGELNSLQKASLPLLAAFGGMALPISIFLLLNTNPTADHGWGVPMATDIAFTLAILKLLGNRVPIGLKVFLTAFAIVDDIGAVLVIGLYYSESVQWGLIGWAMLPLLALFLLAHFQRYHTAILLALGLVTWVLFVKSGLHPTIAGILLAFTVPIKAQGKSKAPAETPPPSPLHRLEHSLHNWVAYLVIPIFALSNAGINLGAGPNLDTDLLLTLALSLVLGNLIGILAFSYLGIRLRWARLPVGVNFRMLLGASFLAGVGFTMSIFIANLAFVATPALMNSAKLGILLGSLVSGLVGFLILRTCPLPENAAKQEAHSH